MNGPQRLLVPLLVFLLLAAAGTGGAQAPGAQPGAPIKLGLIDIYSGGFAFVADSIRTGFQIAVDEANAAGGVGGRPFTLVTADMGGSVEKAVTEARRMILEEQIKYITVGIHSGAAVALASLAKQYKVLVLGGFATTKRLTGEAGSAYVGRANLSTVEIGRVMAEYLKDRPEVKRIAVIAPDYEYGQHFSADFVAQVKVVRPDIVVVREEWPKLGASDFAPHVTALQANPVDMVVAGVFGADLVNFLKSARDFGLFGPKTRLFVHGLDLVKIGTLKDVLPEGTLGTVWYPFYAITSAKSQQFTKEITRRMGTYPTGSTAVGYVAGRMVTDAIKKAGGADNVEKVIAAMAGLEFEGATGHTKVRGCDNMALYNFYVGVVKRDPALPDGIGVTDVKAFYTEPLARSCDEIMKVRGS